MLFTYCPNVIIGCPLHDAMVIAMLTWIEQSEVQIRYSTIPIMAQAL